MGSRAGSSDTSTGEYGGAITIDSQGDIYVTGQATNGAEFGGETITHPESKKRPRPTSELFLAKMDATNGEFQWARMPDGSLDSGGYDITVTSDAIYVGGTGYSLYAASVAKFDLSGTLLWTRESEVYGSVHTIAADGEHGNLYVVGTFDYGGYFGPFHLTPPGPINNGGYLVKLDANSPDGTVLSARRLARVHEAFQLMAMVHSI